MKHILVGRCVEADLGYLGCAMDVLHLADKRCSGRRECQIRIPDAELDTTKPCFKELKTYLEASYTCVPGKMLHIKYQFKIVQRVLPFEILRGGRMENFTNPYPIFHFGSLSSPCYLRSWVPATFIFSFHSTTFI